MDWLPRADYTQWLDEELQTVPSISRRTHLTLVSRNHLRDQRAHVSCNSCHRWPRRSDAPAATATGEGREREQERERERDGSECEVIKRDGKRWEVERETDYVWFLTSDPITFITRSWWTHRDIDGCEIPIWMYYSLNLRVITVRLCVCSCVCAPTLSCQPPPTACDNFYYCWSALICFLGALNAQLKTQINTYNLQAANWKKKKKKKYI